MGRTCRDVVRATQPFHSDAARFSALAPRPHLVRDPAQVIASYATVCGAPKLEDIRLPQQREILKQCGGPVVGGDDLPRDPAGGECPLPTATRRRANSPHA
jgi:hypothetical protein